MKITYISASILPSTKANSVNVMKMCNGFSENGHEVTLVGTLGANEKENIYAYYKVDKTFKLRLARNNKLSSINRLLYGLRYSINADIVYTRWIIAAFFLILFSNKDIIYEHHAPLNQGLNKLFESRIIKSKKVKRHVFITNALKEYYLKHYPEITNKDMIVLADGADLIENDNKQIQKDLDCIYVGSFQKGKGLETVIELANRLPTINFGIVGGSEDEVKSNSVLTINNNVRWFGYLPHEKTHAILKRSKIALLPNQPKVVIDNSSQDIGKWTSPMKLFEYMANKQAVIASDLKVLKEVLIDGENCLLVSHNDLSEWENTINKLLSDNELLERVSNNAYNDLKENYTWKSRAKHAIKNLNL
jgi:glycosyltransferase involved in cell wall biosynthesis